MPADTPATRALALLRAGDRSEALVVLREHIEADRDLLAPLHLLEAGEQHDWAAEAVLAWVVKRGPRSQQDAPGSPESVQGSADTSQATEAAGGAYRTPGNGASGDLAA